jgi:hypothetical protein
VLVEVGDKAVPFFLVVSGEVVDGRGTGPRFGHSDIGARLRIGASLERRGCRCHAGGGLAVVSGIVWQQWQPCCAKTRCDHVAFVE